MLRKYKIDRVIYKYLINVKSKNIIKMTVGSFIAIQNGKVVSSKDKILWKPVDGKFEYIDSNSWRLLYVSEFSNVTIIYKNNQYTLYSNNYKMYSNDGKNWINKSD